MFLGSNSSLGLLKLPISIDSNSLRNLKTASSMPAPTIGSYTNVNRLKMKSSMPFVVESSEEWII